MRAVIIHEFSAGSATAIKNELGLVWAAILKRCIILPYKLYNLTYKI